ncbi:receptor-type tyrosine-protein phosphatase kappa-like [Ptychodera flava]|uniref:receptor-type tyrosine-protein phosphatase kappa-like n=1 Tax=Ptychodera flava TaxID=63121 RepID=UPI00396A6CED
MRRTEMFVLLNLVTFILPVSITVARLDVTIYNKMAVPSLNSTDYFFGGYSAGDAISTVGTNFSYGRILDTGTGSELPSGYSNESFNDYAMRLYLPTGAGRPGVYYCDANADTGEIERLQTILVGEEADVKPESPTKTVSWGDDVTLTMMSSIPPPSLKWRHNGIQKPEWNGQSSITISFAKPSDAGIYECYSSETQRSQGKHGFMRLIVRDCPNGKWHLPECLFACQTCYNGGICNSDTGECICPPGFMGSQCQTGCGRNTFGMECDRICSSSNPDACRRTMYCLADPYGCSCSTSYGGLDCTDDCSEGRYGPGCSQTCHCTNGCNGTTGECNGGSMCETGWGGSKCNIPDSCPDGFYGELCNYYCHCKNNAACSKATGVCSNGECAPGWIDVDIPDCQQDGNTKIRLLYNTKVNPGEPSSIICVVSGNPVIHSSDVALSDESGSQFPLTSYLIDRKYLFVGNFSSIIVDHGMSLTCGVFGGVSLQLNNFSFYALPRLAQLKAPQIEVEATQATVTWQRWTVEDDIGDGPVEAYKVYYKQSDSDNWDFHRSVAVKDQDQVTYNSVIPDLDWSTGYDFTVTVKRPGPRGEGSKETFASATTLCDVPTEAPGIKASSSTHPNEIEIEIEVPPPSGVKCNHDNTNGYIENVSAKYRKAYSEDSFMEKSGPGGSTSFLVIDGLEPYTVYEIIISFHNKDEQSPWSEPHITRTAEGVPSKPRYVILKPRYYTVEVEWAIPNLTNGVVNRYEISYWETDEPLRTRKVDIFAANLKDVNTFLITELKYDVMYSVEVNAGTRAGLGPPSDAANVQTTVTIPGMPESLNVKEVTTGSVTLMWTDPLIFSGDIIGYGISYRTIGSVFTETKKDSGAIHVGTVKTYELLDLQPGTKYEILVNASTLVGFGEPRILFTGTTFKVDISRVLPMNEDLSKPIAQSDTLVLVRLPAFASDARISNNSKLLDFIVAVEYDESLDLRRRREIDTSLLNGYNNSGESYITALFTTDNVPSTFGIGSGGLYGGYFNAPLERGRRYNIYYGLATSYTGDVVCYLDEQPSLSFLAERTISTDNCHRTSYILGALLAVVLSALIIGGSVVVFKWIQSRRRKKNKGHDEFELTEESQIKTGNRTFGIEQAYPSKLTDTEHKAKRKMQDKGDEFAVTPSVTSVTKPAVKPKQGRVKKPGEDNVYCDMLETQSDIYSSLDPKTVIPDTTIPVSDIARVFGDLLKKDLDHNKTHLELEWQKLNKSSYRPRPKECQIGRLPENVGKNRLRDVLPFDKYRPKLSSVMQDGDSTGYINASFVDSYKTKNAFMVTQKPLPNTEVDFWRMVYDHKSRVIVMLNDEDGNDSYLPPAYDVRQCGSFALELVSVETEGSITERKLTLSMGKESFLIRHFQIHGWRRESANGNLAKKIMELITKIEEIEIEMGPITVHCHNGIDQSGVFCATLYACEQIKVDQVVDIFNAVRSLRNNRPRMVETLEQYRLCYEVMKLYCETNIPSYYNLKA